MKKIFLLIVLFIITSFVAFGETSYTLGDLKMKKGNVTIVYVKESNRDLIKLVIKEMSFTSYIYIPSDLKKVRELIAKYNDWCKIAADNKSILNKPIGDLTTTRIDFQTNDGKYEVAFVETRTGVSNIILNQVETKTFIDIISDKNIDLVINDEKRKKEKEDKLFQ